MANEGEKTTAHFFLGSGDEGLGTRRVGMRPEESDSELLEDEEDEVVRSGKGMSFVGDPGYTQLGLHSIDIPLSSFPMCRLPVKNYSLSWLRG